MVGENHGALSIHRWHRLPKGESRVFGTITNVTAHNLTSADIER
jgi:hypothetical protein